MKEHIHSLLVSNGPTGVNAIAKELNKPVTTVYNWLRRQRYFVQDDQKKWCLPGQQYKLEEWPLNERAGETKPEEKVKEIINDPASYISEILHEINRMSYLGDLLLRRAAYFRRLAERAVRNVQS